MTIDRTLLVLDALTAFLGIVGLYGVISGALAGDWIRLVITSPTLLFVSTVFTLRYGRRIQHFLTHQDEKTYAQFDRIPVETTVVLGYKNLILDVDRGCSLHSPNGHHKWTPGINRAVCTWGMLPGDDVALHLTTPKKDECGIWSYSDKDDLSSPYSDKVRVELILSGVVVDYQYQDDEDAGVSGYRSEEAEITRIWHRASPHVHQALKEQFPGVLVEKYKSLEEELRDRIKFNFPSDPRAYNRPHSGPSFYVSEHGYVESIGKALADVWHEGFERASTDEGKA